MELTKIDQLLAATTMIAWPKPTMGRLLNFVIVNDQGNAAGTILSQREVFDWTGISRTLIHKHLAELVDRRVLLRLEGGGPRGHAYRFNPRVREWRVPWLASREPTVNESPSREWLSKREIALGRLHRFLYPDVGHKSRSVARPVAALTSTVARADARLLAPCDATGRATEAPLVTRPGARQARADSPATQFPLIEPLSHSLEVREGANRLRAAIRERSGAEIWGELADQIVALGCDTKVDRAIDRVRKAQPGLSIKAYIGIVQGALTEPDLPAPASAPMWVAPDTSDAKPAPWIAAGMTRAEWAASCETVSGGVS